MKSYNESEIKSFIKWAKNNKIFVSNDPKEIFEQKKLDFKNKSISKLPSEICALTNLEELDLTCNHLTALPKDFSKLENLVSLKLGSNNFDEVSSAIFNLKKLESLDFESNQIKTMPKEIGNLTNLIHLSFYHNQLHQVPEELGNLTQLKELDLSSNSLTHLPATIGKLIHLVYLNIWSNKIEDVPEAIKALPHLKDFELHISQSNLNRKLIEAVVKDNVKLAETLIKIGADVNFKWQGYDKYEFTNALFEAKSLDMVKLLLIAKADPNTKRERTKSISIKVWEDDRHSGEFETFLNKQHALEVTKYLKSIGLIK